MRLRSIFALWITPTLINAIPTAMRSNKELSHLDPRNAPRHSCLDSDIFAPFQFTGGSHEGDAIKTYCDTHYKDGLVITGIETWYGKSTIDGIKVHYSNGDSSLVYGVQKGINKMTSWEPTDTIDLLEIFGNGNGKWVGRIKIRVKGGSTSEHGQTEDQVNGQQPSTNDIGAGILLGMQLAIDEDNDSGIRRLGFMWLGDKVESAEETDFKFEDSLEDLNSKKKGIDSRSFQDSYYVNHKKAGNSTFNFINSITKEDSVEIATTNQHAVTAGISTSIEAGVIFAKATVDLKLEYQYTRVETKTTKKTWSRMMRWEITNNVIEPGKAIRCQASALEGTYSGDYTSSVRVNLENGKTFKINSKGTMTTIGWSQCFSSCEDVDPADIPNDGEVVDVE